MFYKEVSLKKKMSASTFFWMIPLMSIIHGIIIYSDTTMECWNNTNSYWLCSHGGQCTQEMNTSYCTPPCCRTTSSSWIQTPVINCQNYKDIYVTLYYYAFGNGDCYLEWSQNYGFSWQFRRLNSQVGGYSYQSTIIDEITGKNNVNFALRGDCLWDNINIHVTEIVTSNPTKVTSIPTNIPSMIPSETPTGIPTYIPTKLTDIPTIAPTMIPTSAPTILPTELPTETPTKAPTRMTFDPSKTPTDIPTKTPSIMTTNPTKIPTNSPSATPSDVPTSEPTYNPTNTPTDTPSISPSKLPSTNPSMFPTNTLTNSPTHFDGSILPIKSENTGETRYIIIIIAISTLAVILLFGVCILLKKTISNKKESKTLPSTTFSTQIRTQSDMQIETFITTLKNHEQITKELNKLNNKQPSTDIPGSNQNTNINSNPAEGIPSNDIEGNTPNETNIGYIDHRTPDIGDV